MIGVVNTSGSQGVPLYQYYDPQNQLCHQQWYFMRVPHEPNEQLYSIQSVYNRKVFDVPSGDPSHDAKIQQWTIARHNQNQHFRLIQIGNESLCQIQNVVSKKVLSAITEKFITQSDLKMSPMDLTANKSTIAWQLLPFNKDRLGDEFFDCPYVSTLNDLTVLKFGKIFGDDGGYAIDDSEMKNLTVFHYISAVSIKWSTWLHSITFIYSHSDRLKNEPPINGFPRGHVGNIHKGLVLEDTFNVTAMDFNERINRVQVILGLEQEMQKAYLSIHPTRYVIGIQFHTTHNRSSPFYGSRRGESIVEEFKDGFVMGYARGASGTFVDRLQFIWFKT
ncbi:unnamed protein product [Rotaria sp. Silwood2]|nr:unnamed protein product [Rotaria sp. Silwood2]